MVTPLAAYHARLDISDELGEFGEIELAIWGVIIPVHHRLRAIKWRIHISGESTGTPWALHGHSMGTPWALNGHSMGNQWAISGSLTCAPWSLRP